MTVATTPRLLLRELRRGDVGALAAILGDPEVMRFSVGGPLGVRETEEMIERARRSYAEHGFGRWALADRASGELIGFCGIYLLTVDGVDEPELGYRLARSRWGAGLATEAAIAARDVAHRELGLERLIALIEPVNARSVRVAEKAGFRLERRTIYKGLEVRLYAWSP